MKNLKYIFCAAFLGLTFTACEDLDLEPKGIIDDATLFRSDDGIKKYLAGVYNDLPIEDFNYGVSGDWIGYGTNSNQGQHKNNDYWNALKSYSGSVSGECVGRNTNNGARGSWEYWPYGRIRDINKFITNIETYKSNYTEDNYNGYMAEGRFLRAFYYFGLAKRYGGVPIVDEVQDPFGNAEDLQLPRSTEYATWKFIHDDLAFAMENGFTDTKEVHRGTRFAAAALMSKAMLFAASVANYGATVGTTGPAVNAGLQGMDKGYAQEFYQYAYDACKFLQAAGFKLHSGSDKETAYTEVFIGDNAGEEDIFVKEFGDKSDRTTLDAMALLHCWDCMTMPKGEGLAQDVGCAIQPIWELIGLFEHPALVDAAGRPVRFDALEDFANSPELEPRCKANFFFTGMVDKVSGVTIDLQAGVYKQYPGSAEQGCPENPDADAYVQNYRVQAPNQGTYDDANGKLSGVPGLKISGAHGLGTARGDEDYGYTGAFIRKYNDYTAPASIRTLFGGHHPWKVFRYGEILCNWAEAAYELGLIKNDNALKQEAFDHVNELRDRAGAHRHEMVANPVDVGTEKYGIAIDENLEYIRDERARELCYENQRYWDLRRWRVGDAMFQNFWPHTLMGYYVIPEGKYIFLNEYETHMGRKVTWEKSYYYEQIPGGEINKNPNLVRNDGF